MREMMRRSLLGGLFCVLFGGFVVWQGFTYRMGTLSSMGPGFLPVMLGGLLIVIGIAMLIQSIWETAPLQDVNVRPLVFVSLAIVGFALTINRFGFLPAATVTVLLAGMAQRRINKLHIALLTVGLIVVVYGIFAYLLRMPIDLVRWRP
jgi:hypothetical protein